MVYESKIDAFAILDKISLIKALYYGPVFLHMHANSNFKNYKGGIYFPENCSGKLNHELLIVGYNFEGDQPYIEGLNTCWGSKWGEGGYIRIALGNLHE